ncbi:MAG TPA: helix-turn-helix domain-containing protein [Terracidiphilus sp.]|jgi:AraC-like DNA-binding protein
MVNVNARPRSSKLLPFVRSFHYHQTYLASGLERIVPNAQAHLMINLAENAFRTYDHVRPALVTRHAGAVLAGPHAQSVVLDTSQMCWLAAVEFRAGGAGHFFGMPASEASNQVVSLDVLWRKGGGTLRERLLDASSAQQRFAVVEELLLEHLDQRFDPAVAWAIGAVQRGMRISEIVSQLGLLPRTFERRFASRVGLTPKRFARVRRLQRVLRSIRTGPPTDWTALAIKHGYYDQSHLIHEFRELADITPAAYRPHSAARSNHIPLAAH